MAESTKVQPRIAIQNSRATVSLGMLTPRRHCTFRCPFCYVDGDFSTGPNLPADVVASALRDADLDGVETILISGDTDSFAPPRTAEAVRLVELVADLGTDVAFTTRALLPQSAIRALGLQAAVLAGLGRRLIAITSLTQWSMPRLEPHPIPPPQSRIEQLRRLRESGLVTGVALRPLLPVVPLNDYREILDRVAAVAEFALIGTWYCDSSGSMAAATLGSDETSDFVIAPAAMDFDANEAIWSEYRSLAAEAVCRERADELGLPLFQRSQEAFTWLRSSKAPEEVL